MTYPITINEIYLAIIRFTPLKALGPTLISNLLLQYLAFFSLPLFEQVFNISLELGYYAKLFQNLVMVAMQKLCKVNHTLIKAYCLITLHDTIGKTFELILTKKISAITKIYHLLPNIHFCKKRIT